MLEINGKGYELREAFTIDPSEVTNLYDWGENEYEVNVAQRAIAAYRCFVLVEVES